MQYLRGDARCETWNILLSCSLPFVFVSWNCFLLPPSAFMAPELSSIWLWFLGIKLQKPIWYQFPLTSPRQISCGFVHCFVVPFPSRLIRVLQHWREGAAFLQHGVRRPQHDLVPSLLQLTSTFEVPRHLSGSPTPGCLPNMYWDGRNKSF